MIAHPDYIDSDTLAQAEREAMQRPEPCAMWDDRLYETHAPVMSWAERGDDLLAESNYRSALRLIRDAAGDNADDHVIDASISDWLVGSLRQIFVQVRDDDDTFTVAWRTAVEIALGLQDYPIVDESDFSERESDERDRQWLDALGDARNDYENECYDNGVTGPDDALHERVVAILVERASSGEFEPDRYPDVDYQAVSDAYAEMASVFADESWEDYARSLSNPQTETLWEDRAMPRDIVKTVYTFAELSKSAQSAAAKSVADYLSRTWGDCYDIESMTDTLVYNLAGELGSPGWDIYGQGDFPGIDGVTLSGWDLDRGEHLNLSGTLTRKNAPALPWTREIDYAELSECRPSGGTRITVTANDDESYVPHAKYDAHTADWDRRTRPMRDAIESAIHKALTAGREGLEYLTGEEYAQEWINANEPEFTEDGELV